jgi:hypothetical protein
MCACVHADVCARACVRASVCLYVRLLPTPLALPLWLYLQCPFWQYTSARCQRGSGLYILVYHATSPPFASLDADIICDCSLTTVLMACV